MPIELESQLRTLGRALDSQAGPVSADEITGSSHTRDARSVVEVADPVGVETSDGTKRRSILLAAAAAVLIVGMIGAIAVLERSPEPSNPAVSDDEQPATTAPIDTAPSVAPAPSMPVDVARPTLVEATITPAEADGLRPDVFPIVRDADVSDAFGQYSAEASPTQRVVGLVGRIEGDQLLGGIRIELQARPSSVESGGVAQVVEINGTAVDVYDNGETSTVILPGDPAFALSGADPVSFLENVGVDVVSFDPVRPFESVTVNEAVLPDGYGIVAVPEAEPAGALTAYTATSLANSDGPSVTVSLTNPVSGFAARTPLERTEVNGVPAWAAPTPGGYTIIWPVSESTWAQARARGATDESLTLAESVEFARDIDFVDETEWRSFYRVPEPSFGDSDAVVGIDAGSADGIEVGMLVESNGAPIGRVAKVTDSASDVILVSNPDFSIAATVSPSVSGSASDCRVRGGNDHVGYVCDRAFNAQEQAGAEVVAIGNASTIIEGTSFGTITSIIDINGQPVALLDLITEFPIAGDAATVVVPR